MANLWLEVNGDKYLGFVSGEIGRSLDALSGSFNFNATADKGSKFPIENDSPCRVLIGEKPVLTGYIENIEGIITVGSHNIPITGRDSTADIIDSSLDYNFELNSVISLESVIKKAITKLGIENMQVINNAGSLKKFTESEIVSGEVDESAFNIIERYCRKRQVLCTTDGEGNIVLTRASVEKIPNILLYQINGKNNNILKPSYSSNNSNRYYKYIVKSQSNNSVSRFSKIKVADNSGFTIDTEIRQSRTLIIVAESSMNDADCKNRAIWEKNARKARALSYECEVYGYEYNAQGDIWELNKLIHVTDELWNIDADMLIKGIRYKIDASGAKTILTLTDKNAYSLQAEIDELEERMNTLGGKLK